MKYWIALVFIALYGCANTGDTIKRPNELQALSAVENLQRAWQSKRSLSTDFIGKGWRILGQDLVLAEKKGRVSFSDVLTGDLTKTIQTSLKSISVAVSTDELLIAANRKGRVVAISLDGDENSPEIWDITLTGEVLSRPLILSDKVILRTLDGKIYALGKDDGHVLWSYEKTVPALSLHGTSEPVLNEDKIIIGLDDGQIVALNAVTGRPIWKSAVAVPKGVNAVDRLVDIDSTPVVTSETIYATAYQTRTVALASETGRLLWDSNINSFRDVVLDESTLFIIDNDSLIHALDARTGTTQWSQDALARRDLTAPVVYQGKVIVGDLDGYLHILDYKTGQLLGRTQVSPSPIMFVRQVQDLIVALTDNGTLAAFSLLKKH